MELLVVALCPLTSFISAKGYPGAIFLGLLVSSLKKDSRTIASVYASRKIMVGTGGNDSGVHHSAGKVPAFVFMVEKRILKLFLDESGDPGAFSRHSLGLLERLLNPSSHPV